MSDVVVRALTTAALTRWPLPDPSSSADKEDRGHVLVVAGSAEMPGAAVLAAESALRAGAGKLTMAAPESIATGLGLAVPEARVIGLRQTRSGSVGASAVALLTPIAPGIRAVVMGPGMQDEGRSTRLVAALLPLFAHATVVLDALAMNVVRQLSFAQPVVMTPHAGEMAQLSAHSKDEVRADPAGFARHAADAWNACIALKGAQTFIALPASAPWRFDGGTPGLATSGSGDTLAGLIGGLAARGLSAEAACAWGVVLHSRAGQALSRRVGPVGYLARELSSEVPSQIAALQNRRRRPHSG